MMTNVAIFVIQYGLLGVVAYITSIAYVLLYYWMKYGVETGSTSVIEGCKLMEDDTVLGSILRFICWPVCLPMRTAALMSNINGVIENNER